MINNDSIVTAYDEHLTLVEWLQKVEKLITENALESVQVNNVSASTYTLTLTFADGSSITSNTFDLSTITQALTLIEAKADTALNNSVANASEIAKIKNGTTPLFENITDSHGNKRFVEGNITMVPIEGITQTYGKWSLSGTHLMIVLCISVVSGTTMHVNDTLTTIEVPDYVINKINPLASNLVVVGRFEGREDITLSSDNLDVLLRKDNENQILEIKKANNDKSYSRNLNFRIQFDLLIDNE